MRFLAVNFRMEKKIALNSVFTYLPARLVEGRSRWHIVYSYTDGNTGESHRLKPTFNLNRIKSIAERRKLGHQLVRQINEKLPLGWPWRIVAETHLPVLAAVNLRKAVEKATAIKCVGLETRTKSSYESMTEIFLTFIEKRYGEFSVGAFQRKHAQAFLDYLTTERKTKKGKPLAARSYNAYLFFIKGVWSILISREYLNTDVWAADKERKVTEKIARNYSKEELKIIISAVAERDRWLMLAVVLLYYCFIRPTEITRLRVRNMQIQDNRIMLPGSITKNKKNRTPTVPENVRKFLQSFNFQKHGGHCYVFGREKKRGKKICISPAFPVSYKTFNRRLKAILHDLAKRKMIDSVEDMTFYGLKDTGGQDLIDQGIDVWQLMKQMGHQSLTQTQIYLERKRQVNPAVLNHQTDIFDL